MTTGRVCRVCGDRVGSREQLCWICREDRRALRAWKPAEVSRLVGAAKAVTSLLRASTDHMTEGELVVWRELIDAIDRRNEDRGAA